MNKTILITGSTDGIGKLAAIKLAKDGHEIYLHGRGQDKLTKVIEEVKELSKNENIKGFIADFSDMDDVKQMANQIIQNVPKIDILINNAGVFKSQVQANKNGIDLRIVVNYYAPYILTNSLLPILRKGTDPRIINLSSAAQSSLTEEILTGREMGPENNTYAQSKLALTMWSFFLANTLEDITVVAVNPGSLLNTNMVREAFGKFWSSADKGADILYDLAVSDEHKDANGKYFDNDKGAYGNAHADAYDQAIIDNLMQITKKVELRM